MSKYSYELGVGVFGSHYLTVNLDKEDEPSQSCRVYGEGILDQLSLVFLLCAGFFFTGLRPIRVKLLTIQQEQNLHVKLPPLYATANSVSRIVEHQLRDYAESKHYNCEQNLDPFIFAGLENRDVINLHHSAILMEKQIDLNFHTKWRDIFELFAENFKNMIGSPDAQGFSMFINDEGEIAQNAAEASHGNWHEIKFGLDLEATVEEQPAPFSTTPPSSDSKKELLVERFKIEFPPKARGYYLQKLFETWHSLLNDPATASGRSPLEERKTSSELIQEAIRKISNKLYELEYAQYVINPVRSDRNQVLLTLPNPPKPNNNNGEIPIDIPATDSAVPAEPAAAQVDIPEPEELKIELNAHRINIGDVSYIARNVPNITLESITFFWEMLLQEKSPLIIKLAGMEYWPALDEGVVCLNDDLTLRCVEVNADPKFPFVERVFAIGRPNEEMKTIRQIEFVGWQDMSVPDELVMQEFLNRIDLKRQELGMTKDTPITVHCAAGVGRTGTLIASHAIKQKPELKTLDAVNSMRKQRPFPMVENAHQYLFIQKMRGHYNKPQTVPCMA